MFARVITLPNEQILDSWQNGLIMLLLQIYRSYREKKQFEAISSMHWCNEASYKIGIIHAKEYNDLIINIIYKAIIGS